MLVYDWMWWGHLINQNLEWRCAEVHEGARRCAGGYIEVHGGGGEKNQDFMFIRFLNAGISLDVVGTLNQSESCTEVHEGVRRGTQRCRAVVGEKIWIFMLIRFLNAGIWLDVVRILNNSESCVEVHGGDGEKNQDFMLIRFLNTGVWLDVVGTLKQSELCAEVCGGMQGFDWITCSAYWCVFHWNIL